MGGRYSKVQLGTKPLAALCHAQHILALVPHFSAKNVKGVLMFRGCWCSDEDASATVGLPFGLSIAAQCCRVADGGVEGRRVIEALTVGGGRRQQSSAAG